MKSFVYFSMLTAAALAAAKPFKHFKRESLTSFQLQVVAPISSNLNGSYVSIDSSGAVVVSKVGSTQATPARFYTSPAGNGSDETLNGKYVLHSASSANGDHVLALIITGNFHTLNLREISNPKLPDGTEAKVPSLEGMLYTVDNNILNYAPGNGQWKCVDRSETDPVTDLFWYSQLSDGSLRDSRSVQLSMVPVS